MSVTGFPVSSPAQGDKARLWSILIHFLYLVGAFPVGLIIAYVKRPDFAGTIYEGHMTFAIRTFWVCILFAVSALALRIVGMEFITLFIGGIWTAVRVVVGLVRAIDAKPIVNPRGWVI
ncbi:DUF4870 family protein [Nitrospirillum iridis]|uniref:Putative membrane protein n=1 Tax=Nitrospirillum iridis TaxID=765888 RepID=A0A7X0AWS5_9PROT|nr:hypothetical protein [Nitrospirillum iridis]MBB6250736.1 putative membrane protein [Nitrospirillum iridis]